MNKAQGNLGIKHVQETVAYYFNMEKREQKQLFHCNKSF